MDHLLDSGLWRSRRSHAVLFGYLLGFRRRHIDHILPAATQRSFTFAFAQNGNQGFALAAFIYLAFFHDIPSFPGWTLTNNLIKNDSLATIRQTTQLYRSP
jgi:hypothetical protein